MSETILKQQTLLCVDFYGAQKSVLDKGMATWFTIPIMEATTQGRSR